MHEGARDRSARLSVALCAIASTARLCIAIAVRGQGCDWLDAITEQHSFNVVRNDARIHAICVRFDMTGSGRGRRSAADPAFCDQLGSAPVGFLCIVVRHVQYSQSRALRKLGSWGVRTVS